MSVLSRGMSTGFPATVSGLLRVIGSAEDTASIVPGDIAFIRHGAYRNDSLVTAYRAVLAGAVGLIREGGGRTDHGSVAAKELGVPCVQVEPGHDLLLPHAGRVVTISHDVIAAGPSSAPARDLPSQYDATRHPVKVNMGFPEVLAKYPFLPQITDGVGFARVEFALLAVLGALHPLEYVRRHGVDPLAEALASAFRPAVEAYARLDKPVWIRTDDLTPDQLFELVGGDRHEAREGNPNAGWRGIRRSVAQPEMVIPQFRAFRMLADEGFRNIGVFPPMVTHAEQYRRWRGIADSEGLRNVRFGLMVETPRAALAIRDFIPMIEFVVFGTNDLTQFLVATDRGNPLVASLFDETDPVVLDVIRSTAGACEEAGVETCVGGQIASSPKHLPSILAAGLTGVSVNPDPFTVAEIRRVVAAAESRA